MKTRILRWITTTKWTGTNVLLLISLLATDGAVHEQLLRLGMSQDAVDWAVSAAKLTLIAAIALGFSPLERPSAPSTPPTDAPQ